ncbi:MAG: flagellar protein FlgN [Alicyclobacillus sp.]|nr:flagellar protein FlgN [Alicyclobacillus sp.]
MDGEKDVYADVHELTQGWREFSAEGPKSDREGQCRRFAGTGLKGDLKMRDALDRLVTLVDKLLAEHKRLLALCLRQREALVQRDAQLLCQVVAEMETVVHAIERLEAERMDTVRHWAGVLGVDPAAVTLASLAGHLDAERFGRVSAAGAQLRAVMEDIRCVNEGNHALVEQGLQFIRKTLALLANAAAAGPGYGPRLARTGQVAPAWAVDCEA